MKDDPSISGKKTVEESVVESSWMWVDGVFQDGLIIKLWGRVQTINHPQSYLIT